MKLVLASSSPRRKDILEQYGYKFDILSKDVDETMSDRLTVIENVLDVSLRKAKAVFETCKEGVILSCDTIVVFENIIYGKPRDINDAFKTLKTLSGKTHEVISAFTVMVNNEIYNKAITSYVTFKELSDNDILDYIETKECFGKAGSYAIQGIGSKLVLKHEGDLNNIIGLPIDEIAPIIDKYLGE